MDSRFCGNDGGGQDVRAPGDAAFQRIAGLRPDAGGTQAFPGEVCLAKIPTAHMRRSDERSHDLLSVFGPPTEVSVEGRRKDTMENVMYAAIAFAAPAFGTTAIGAGIAANAFGDSLRLSGTIEIPHGGGLVVHR